MDALGHDMDALGKKLDAASHRAEGELRAIVRRAIASGLAKPIA
jgi:hypothetical protein